MSYDKLHMWDSFIKVAESEADIANLFYLNDRFCGLVIRIPVYRSRGLSSIPDTTRFSEK
jgi:hypothetical protein